MEGCGVNAVEAGALDARYDAIYVQLVSSAGPFPFSRLPAHMFGLATC